MSQTLLLLPPFEAQSSTDEDDYIDIDITSTTTTTTFISFSPPHSKDFQFHFSSSSSSSSPKNPHLSTSPADELFYKGKLLPLHLPPRLQMVQTLLQTTDSTPSLHSCNNIISPSTSCHASGELNPDDFSFDPCSVSLVQSSTQKKSWSKKLKRMKHSSLSYLKSLFSKSKCSDESPAAAAAIVSQEVCIHRRSFSSAIKWHNATKFSSSASSLLSSSSSSSSFSSASSSSSVATPMLKRSSSVNSEVEISIQGAIAYCKKSQQLVSARKDFCR